MEYQEIVDKIMPKEKSSKNLIIAFFSGGIIGLVSEILVSILDVNSMLVIWIFLASLLTGLGTFDNICDQLKMGIIIPITGFAHSLTASTIDYKKDGFITGIGSNYFKLAGSVILYGIVSAALLASFRGLLCLL